MSFSSAYLSRLGALLSRIDATQMDKALETIKRHWLSGAKIIIFGNGGSALTASHFVTDWNKMVYLKTKRPFHGICLNENVGLITAYANDISYPDVFRQQLENWVTKGDLVIAISGSGNSENVVRAIAYANEVGAHTLALVGFSGGRLLSLATQSVWIPVDDMQLAEDMHLVFGHIVMQYLTGS